MDVQLLWDEDFHIRVEEGTLCMEVLTLLYEMKDRWSAALVKLTLESTIFP